MACQIGLVVEDLTAGGSLDVFTIADMTNAEGLLGNAPHQGDLIRLDWRDGAEWQAGGRGPYTFDVPLVMKGADLPTRLANLRTFQALEGHKVRLTRTLYLPSGPVVEQCDAVMANAAEVRWDLRERNWLRVILIVQALTPWSAP